MFHMAGLLFRSQIIVISKEGLSKDALQYLSEKGHFLKGIVHL